MSTPTQLAPTDLLIELAKTMESLGAVLQLVLAEHAMPPALPEGLEADADDPAIRTAAFPTKTLLVRGRLHPMDELHYEEKRKGRLHRAVILPDGWIRTVNGEYRQPSPALRDLVGHEINGNWFTAVDRLDGQRKTLRQMKQDAGLRVTRRKKAS